MLDPKDLIKEKLDIVDVIREFLPLKPAGSNWKSLCPFHKEKSPSFMVSPDRQTWHCFGCNKGGDVFSFIMEKEGMEFPEVLRMFAERTGVELKRGDVKLQNQKTKLLDIMEAAVEWWHARLASEEGKEAQAYLAKRGITPETIVQWQMGFAPEAWDRLSQYLVTKGFTLADIIASGLVIERQRTSGDRRLPFYDRFRSRIMIPIRDHHGAAIGTTGRLLPSHEGKKEEGKYVNTPETVLYNKGRVLFGLDRAKETIKERGFAVIVEGNMDAIASHMAGVLNVVAVSGTALTPEHAKLLHRYTDAAALCFDADSAGQVAARRGVDVLLKEGLQLSVITLPNGMKDPDECIQKNPALWGELVEKREPMFDAFFARARTRDLTNVREKKAVAKDLLPLIAKIPDPVERSHYLKKLAVLLEVAETFLYEALPKEQERMSRPQQNAPAADTHEPTDRRLILSERLLAAALMARDHLPHVLQTVRPEIIAVGPLRDLYADLHSLYNQHQSFEGIEAVFASRKELIDRLALAAEHFFGSFDRVAIAKEVQASARELQRHAIREELASIQHAIKRANEEEAAALLARVDALTRALASFH